MNGLCLNCGKTASFLCQRCGDSYCSAMCQAAHWPIHSQECLQMPELVDASSVSVDLSKPSPPIPSKIEDETLLQSMEKKQEQVKFVRTFKVDSKKVAESPSKSVQSRLKISNQPTENAFENMKMPAFAKKTVKRSDLIFKNKIANEAKTSEPEPVSIIRTINVDTKATETTMAGKIKFPKIEKKVTKTAYEKRLTLDDIKMIPLPLGANIKLIVLDNSYAQLNKITACVETDENRDFYMKMDENMMKHVATLKPGYSPKWGEICMAQYLDPDTNGWYRAVCVKADFEKDSYSVKFIDFGNVSECNQKQVIKMPEQLLEMPCVANTCIVKGSFAENALKKELGDVVCCRIEKERSTGDCQYILIPTA